MEGQRENHHQQSESTTCSSVNTSYYETPLNSPNYLFAKNVSETSDECSHIWQNDKKLTLDQFDLNSFIMDKMSPCDSIKTLVSNQNSKSDAYQTDSDDMDVMMDNISIVSNRRNLWKKFHTIVNHMKFIQSECSKAQIFEKQLVDLCQQLKQYREKLVHQNSIMIKLLNEFLHILNEKNSTGHSSNITSFSSSYIERERFKPENLRISNYNQNNQLHNSSEFGEDLKHRLRRLPAMVKGYLVRRLMMTEKVTILKRTIRDTSAILLNFKQNLIASDGKLVVTHEDVVFHKRLCIQLEKSCKEFYSIFMQTPIYKQMEMIRKHREHIRNVLFYSKQRKRSNSMSQSTMNKCSSLSSALSLSSKTSMKK